MTHVHLENSRNNKFSYMYSCDLEENVQIKIGTLEGDRPRPTFRDLINDPLLRYSGAWQEGCSDLYVTCQIFSDGAPLTLPIQTAYKPFSSRWSWNEWLSLPIKFSDLPRHALLAFTIWDVYKPNQPLAIGGTTISLFGKNGALRQGVLDLRVWPNVEADGKGNSTPGRTSSHSSQMNRLAKLTKKYRNGQMTKVDWLDRLTFREVEVINEQEKRASQCMYLMVEFPQILYGGQIYTLVYFEKEGDKPCSVEKEAEICTIADPEIGKENLVESKHHKLARSIRSGVTDKDLKPVHDVRDKLNKIMNYPPTKALTLEEQDLVWKFRFYLKNDKKGLAKFLKCVNWDQNTEARQALQLLGQWQPMDVEDALELLSSQFSNPAVRRYAIARLQQASNEDLLLYLLQLVQALKYENFDEIEAACLDFPKRGSIDQSSIEKDKGGSVVEAHSRSDSSYTEVEDIDETISNSPFNKQLPSVDIRDTKWGNVCDLATFLISRACANDALCNFFYWYVFVEAEDQIANGKDVRVHKMYSTVLKRFSLSLSKGPKEYKQRRNNLTRQKALVEKIVNIMKTVAKESGNRQKKIERLQALLSDPEQELISFEPMPLPLDPSVLIKGIIPEKATLFKSSLMPARLHFVTSDNQEYITIFKHGDDLRQDQLILQTITLMDKLWKKEKMELKLTPYRVLATSNKHGFVQFIDSIPLAEVLKTEETIQNFLRKHAPSENSPYGICPKVMENYIKSCAGYCVITYLLGVGDRHLDNLLITKKGNLFHIDFGYILGRDPKPYPPPMKLSKEMIEAMGGTNSVHYISFRTCSVNAFSNLRRHANLILNLFSLMVDANIPDIALEPDKTVKKIQEKLKLDVNDEEALHYLLNIVDASASAVMAVFVEKLHSIAQYWKR